MSLFGMNGVYMSFRIANSKWFALFSKPWEYLPVFADKYADGLENIVKSEHEIYLFFMMIQISSRRDKGNLSLIYKWY